MCILSGEMELCRSSALGRRLPRAGRRSTLWRSYRTALWWIVTARGGAGTAVRRSCRPCQRPAAHETGPPSAAPLYLYSLEVPHLPRPPR